MASPKRKGKFFLGFFFLIASALVGYYAIPWGMKKASGFSVDLRRAILMYPDLANFDPNPSACHDSWGCVNFDLNPRLRGRLPPYPSARLKHPTMIYLLPQDSSASTFLVSIDGTNEGSSANPYAAHTMMHAGIPGIPHGARVRVRIVGGALSNLYGDRTLWMQDSRLVGHGDAGAWSKRLPSDAYLYQTSDGYFVDALLISLRSASGRHTPGQKFCVMETPNTPFGPQKECSDELEFTNELGEDVWVALYNNSAWTWMSHLTGADTLSRDYFAKGAGLNGDRLAISVRYIR